MRVASASQQIELPDLMMISRAIVSRLSVLLATLIVVASVVHPVSVAASETPVSPIAPPEVSAAAVYVMDATTGIPLYTKNPDDRRAIGSVVKIMTALVTLKWISDPDNTTVLIVQSDLVEPGYSSMNLQVGDTLTITQLLYGLMLPSGGDAANALCRYVGGVISNVDNANIACESFVGEMNTYATELGLTNSRFTNPDGRDADYAYSSAYDVLLMTEAMMNNSRLMTIIQNPAYRFDSIGNPSHEYAADSTLQPHLTNGIIGGKTGSEIEAGGNVAAIREVNSGSNRVIIVVMGSTLQYDENFVPIVDTRWDDVAAITSAMDAQFTWTDPSLAGVIPGLREQMMVWDVELINPPAVPIPVDGGVNMAFQLLVGPLVSTGEPAGTLFLFFGTTPVGNLPLYQASLGSITGEVAV